MMETESETNIGCHSNIPITIPDIFVSSLYSKQGKSFVRLSAKVTW